MEASIYKVIKTSQKCFLFKTKKKGRFRFKLLCLLYFGFFISVSKKKTNFDYANKALDKAKLPFLNNDAKVSQPICVCVCV